MSTITPQQAITYAKNAGFTGVNLATIVAIAMAESGLQTDVRGKTDPRDRGVLQINSYWHSNVSDQCAFDPQCAFNAAFTISRGTDFSQWATYKNGDYKGFMNTSINPTPGCPWYCQIPTGIGNATVALPGMDCSACQTPATTVGAQVAVSKITDPLSSLLQPLLAALPGIGVK